MSVRKVVWLIPYMLEGGQDFSVISVSRDGVRFSVSKCRN